MKKIKPIILLLAGVLLLTSCNFNDIFEPILEIPEVPTAEFSERPTDELITEEKTSETDEPEEELILYFDPSSMLSDSTFQELDFNITDEKYFAHYSKEISYETYFDESQKDRQFKAVIPINGGREIEAVYNQTYNYKLDVNTKAHEFLGEDIRIVYDGAITELEDFSVDREERGYRPAEDVALKNATELFDWYMSIYEWRTDDVPYTPIVTMNPIIEEGGTFDGAGTVAFVKYAHGIKTQNQIIIKFNCDGIPYAISAITAETSLYLYHYIDKAEVEAKSKLIDDTFGDEYEIGEKELVSATEQIDGNMWFITTELSKTDESGNKMSTRVYVPVETNDKPPLA